LHLNIAPKMLPVSLSTIATRRKTSNIYSTLGSINTNNSKVSTKKEIILSREKIRS